MSDNYDFEDELAESIAQIVDEETADAENLYRKKSVVAAGKNTSVKANNSSVRDDFDDDDDEEDSISPKAKLAIILVSVLVTIGIIVGIAVFFINSTLQKNKDNYGYYQNLAYQAKDQDKDFAKAIEYFNDAFQYKDKLLNKVTVSIDGKDIKASEILVKDMLNLRDCYSELNRIDEEIAILKEVLKYDSLNENAIYYLVARYSEKEKYDEILNLYNSIKDRTDVSEKIMSFFTKFKSDLPLISPAAGEYHSDQSVSFVADSEAKVYYTLDGSNPLEGGSLYTQEIKLSEGNTTIKYYITNKYGFSSEVVSVDYNIEYKAPDVPKVNPASGLYETSSEQLIIIGNIPSGADAYYEISYSDSYIKPTKESTKYTEPFAMPEGSSIISVVIIDSNGLASEVVVNNYTLRKVDKFSDTAALELIWSTLKMHEIVNKKNKTKDGAVMELSYNSKKEIDGKLLWIFTVKLDDKKEKYFYGCDANTGDVFKVSKDSETDEYKLKQLKY